MKHEQMSEHEKNAKMSVLQHLKKVAEDAMKEHMDGGMKKVAVMSDSPEGLKQGLEHAKGMVGALDSEEEGSHKDEGDDSADPLDNQLENHLTRGDVNSPDESTHSDELFASDHSKEPEDGDLEDAEAVPGESEESPEHEAKETPAEEAAEHEGEDQNLSHEEIDAKIARLMHLKQSKMHG